MSRSCPLYRASAGRCAASSAFPWDAGMLAWRAMALLCCAWRPPLHIHRQLQFGHRRKARGLSGPPVPARLTTGPPSTRRWTHATHLRWARYRWKPARPPPPPRAPSCPPRGVLCPPQSRVASPAVRPPPPSRPVAARRRRAVAPLHPPMRPFQQDARLREPASSRRGARQSPASAAPAAPRAGARSAQDHRPAASAPRRAARRGARRAHRHSWPPPRRRRQGRQSCRPSAPARPASRGGRRRRWRACAQPLQLRRRRPSAWLRRSPARR
mmetsp:Transcript_1603/g.5133  ORF Transcript_1603/g.5133 Transcript_1603/m.5133 type:complete len:270 (+) Transcript_1603:100-909(+)